jgi:hypothetical protein
MSRVAKGRIFRGRETLLAMTALGLAVLVPVFVSCADAGETTSNEDASAEGSTLDRPDSGLDASADAGCDPVDPNCTAKEVPCEQASWCPVTTSTVDARTALTAVWGSSKNDVWAVGGAGSIVHWDGLAWIGTPSGTTQTLRGVWGSGPNDVWIVSTPTVILHGGGFENGAATFARAVEIERWNTYFPSLTLAVWGPGTGDVWLGGEPIPLDWDHFENGWRKTVADGGTSWEGMPIAPSTQSGSIRSFWGSRSGEVWAVGGDDREIRDTDGTMKIVSFGRTFHAQSTQPGDGGAPDWTEFDSQTTAILYGVWGSSADDVWAVGRRGTIRRWTTGATRWAPVASPTSAHLRAVWGSGPNDVWAVGDYGTILHFDGTSWKSSSAALPIGVKPHLYGVWGSGPDDVWAVGERGILHFSGPKPGIDGDGR